MWRVLLGVGKTRRGTMRYFTYTNRRPPRINFRATDIGIYYNYINDFPKASIAYADDN